MATLDAIEGVCAGEWAGREQSLLSRLCQRRVSIHASLFDWQSQPLDRAHFQNQKFGSLPVRQLENALLTSLFRLKIWMVAFLWIYSCAFQCYRLKAVHLRKREFGARNMPDISARVLILPVTTPVRGIQCVWLAQINDRWRNRLLLRCFVS